MFTITDKNKPLFGFCDIDWFNKNDTRPIETVKIVKVKAIK